MELSEQEVYLIKRLIFFYRTNLFQLFQLFELNILDQDTAYKFLTEVNYFESKLDRYVHSSDKN